MTTNKVVAITGAGGAVAEKTIEVFKSAGWQLALFAHSDNEKGRLGQAHPDAFVTKADLGRDDEAKRAVNETLEKLGHIDALLNIAGGFSLNPALETSSDDLKGQLAINLWTTFNTTRAVLPNMIERGQGFIIGVGAGAAVGGGSKLGPYAASKAAMIAYLKSVQAEVGAKGIGVAVVYPMGSIDTPGNRKSMPDADPEKWIDPVELAETMLYLVSRSPRGRIREVMVYPSS
jgi:NAD(P)-dependent dehydrogenase (short-subunit alcohol dehydrogenase family)